MMHVGSSCSQISKVPLYQDFLVHLLTALFTYLSMDLTCLLLGLSEFHCEIFFTSFSYLHLESIHCENLTCKFIASNM